MNSQPLNGSSAVQANISHASTVLPPIQVNEFLPPLGYWIKFGGLWMVGMVGLAVALTAVVQYKVTVRGQASIRPTGELRLVQAATEGIIQSISANENQLVHQGDVIAIIEDSRLQIQQNQLQNNVHQAGLQVSQINAQIRALDSQIAAEMDRRNGAVASAEAELTQRQRDYQERQATTRAEMAAAKANLQSTEAGFNAAKIRFERYREVANVGALSQDRLEEARLEMQQQQQAVSAAQSKLASAEAALNPTNAEVAMATQQIAEQQAGGTATIANLNKEREALIQQRIHIQNQLERDSHELRQVEFELSKTTIAATADGIISQLNLRNPGQTVKPGDEIAQIVPSGAQLMIKALVTAQDISKIAAGQKAQLRVSACPYPDYGTLNGTVKTIAPDAIPPQTLQTPVSSAARVVNPTKETSATLYEVTIQPDHLTLRRGNKNCQIQLGMEGRIDIITRKETVLRFLLRKARLITDL